MKTRIDPLLMLAHQVIELFMRKTSRERLGRDSGRIQRDVQSVLCANGRILKAKVYISD